MPPPLSVGSLQLDTVAAQLSRELGLSVTISQNPTSDALDITLSEPADRYSPTRQRMYLRQTLAMHAVLYARDQAHELLARTVRNAARELRAQEHQAVERILLEVSESLANVGATLTRVSMTNVQPQILRTVNGSLSVERVEADGRTVTAGNDSFINGYTEAGNFSAFGTQPIRVTRPGMMDNLLMHELSGGIPEKTKPKKRSAWARILEDELSEAACT